MSTDEASNQAAREKQWIKVRNMPNQSDIRIIFYTQSRTSKCSCAPRAKTTQGLPAMDHLLQSMVFATLQTMDTTLLRSTMIQVSLGGDMIEVIKRSCSE